MRISLLRGTPRERGPGGGDGCAIAGGIIFFAKVIWQKQSFASIDGFARDRIGQRGEMVGLSARKLLGISDVCGTTEMDRDTIRPVTIKNGVNTVNFLSALKGDPEIG